MIGNMLLYVNDTTYPGNRFEAIYDDGNVLNLHGEVSYQLREKLRIMIAGDYFDYKMKHEIRAWYKPQVKLSFAANYNLSDKIIVKADLFYLESQFAKTHVNGDDSTGKIVAEELNNLFDVNIGGEYRYTKRLGFFLNLSNIMNARYLRYMNYPTQRFSLMGGLSYSF
jgi:outer membrane receptor protein involved in Fe transport